MDIVHDHDDIRDNFAESVFYYILYEIMVEINKRHGIQICAFDYST